MKTLKVLSILIAGILAAVSVVCGCGGLNKPVEAVAETTEAVTTPTETTCNHAWVDATCTTPKTCSKCGKTEDEALGHTVSEWTIITEATCSESGLKTGICQICNEEISETIPKTDHVPGDWEITVPADYYNGGIAVIRCINCGAELKSSSYDLSDEEKEALYKSNCEWISYEDLARNPNSYVGRLVCFEGKVLQVLESNNPLYYSTYRINVTKHTYNYIDSEYWEDTVYVNYDTASASSRVLEDDVVMFYGEFQGLKTYETIFGENVTIPHVIAEYIDFEYSGRN